jgi:hypothetical protein
MMDEGARRVGIGVALVACIGGAVWLATRPSDETRIRAQLARLAKVAHVTEDDVQTNPIGRLAHVNGELETLVDRDVRVSIPEIASLGSGGRRELAQAITSAPRWVRTFEVDFEGITIKLDDARVTALVGATADARALETSGRVREDKRAVDFRFAKQDGEWIVTTISVWRKDDAPPR